MSLALSDPLLPIGIEQGFGAAHRALGIVHPQAHGANRGAVQLEMLRSGAILLLVEHQIGAALAVKVHSLRPMPSDVAEPERTHEIRQSLTRSLVNGKLQE